MLRRIVHEQMDMIVLTIHADETGFEIDAHLFEDGSETGDSVTIEYPLAIFGYEDQMHMHLKDAMSTVSDFA